MFIILIIVTLVIIIIWAIFNIFSKPENKQLELQQINSYPISIPISYSLNTSPSYDSTSKKLIEYRLKRPTLGSAEDTYITLNAEIPLLSNYKIDDDLIIVENDNSAFILKTSLGEDAGLFDNKVKSSELTNGVFIVEDENMDFDLPQGIKSTYLFKYYYSNEMEFSGCFGISTHCGVRELKLGDYYFKAYCLSNNTSVEECNNIVTSIVN